MRCSLDQSKEILMFYCLGCEEHHGAYVKGPKAWTWNWDLEKPTLSPSILVRSTQGEARTPKVCHSYVKDGQIQYLNDCTHALKGQTIDLPEWNS